MEFMVPARTFYQRFFVAWGEGGGPLPPLFYFFRWGVPTPPCAGQGGDHPPPPPGPAGRSVKV